MPHDLALVTRRSGAACCGVTQLRERFEGGFLYNRLSKSSGHGQTIK